jgi:hypothetical protein
MTTNRTTPGGSGAIPDHSGQKGRKNSLPNGLTTQAGRLYRDRINNNK